MLDVVVREFAQLMVVDAEDLCFFGGAQAEARDQVHDEENDAGAEERIGEAGDGVGQLVAELDVVPVEPATGDNGHAVEVGDVVALAMLVSGRA